jgi:hypothetical protein
MTNKITRLTPGQQAILPQFREEWLRWGICTERADRPKAEAAVMAIRARIGVPEKPIFVWVDSPATGCLAIHFLKNDGRRDGLGASLGATLRDSLWASLGASLGDSLWDSLWDSLRASLWDSLGDSLWDSLWDSLRASLWDSLGDSLWDSLGDSLRASLWDSLGDSLWDSLRDGIGDSLRASLWASFGEAWWGQYDSYWIAFYLFCRDVIGVKYDAQKSADLDLWRDIGQSCCWWWCYRNYVICCERPTTCRLDERGVIHNEKGPAVAFADGWTIHAWHGVRVPGDWIEHKEHLTAQVALAEPNTERRRAACEIVGWGRVIAELKGQTINKDADPEIGELIEVNLPDNGPARFLRVQCGTKRSFAIPVPLEMKTALQANGWTYGLDATDYQPEVRT